jgi:hypothetical protein
MPKGFGGLSFIRQRWKRLFLHMGIRASSGLHPLQWVGHTGTSPVSSTITDTVIDTIVSVTVSAFLCHFYGKQGEF